MKFNMRRRSRIRGALLAAVAAAAISIGYAVWPADDPEVVEHSHNDLPDSLINVTREKKVI